MGLDFWTSCRASIYFIRHFRFDTRSQFSARIRQTDPSRGVCGGRLHSASIAQSWVSALYISRWNSRPRDTPFYRAICSGCCDISCESSHQPSNHASFPHGDTFASFLSVEWNAFDADRVLKRWNMDSPNVYALGRTWRQLWSIWCNGTDANATRFAESWSCPTRKPGSCDSWLWRGSIWVSGRKWAMEKYCVSAKCDSRREAWNVCDICRGAGEYASIFSPSMGTRLPQSPKPSWVATQYRFRSSQ